jgi:hypothetical protein
MSASLLSERHKTHGEWSVTARVAQRLKRVLWQELAGREARQQPALGDSRLEALMMICTKIGRIVAGDPDHADHWRDISGYALLGIEFDADADARGSFEGAIGAIGARARETGELPTTGYFGSSAVRAP